jgi:hypothetical protein
MNIIELKYKKNSKFEIEFENLDEIKENDNVLLRLKDGDLSPLFISIEHLKVGSNLYIPYIIHISEEIRKLLVNICNKYSVHLFLFDKNEIAGKYNNILPKWNIPEDSAVLFFNGNLSIGNCEKYKDFYKKRIFISYFSENKLKICDDNFLYITLEELLISYKIISLILPQFHAQDKNCQYHINNINKVCKELKEKYGVERVELFLSHCFIEKDNLPLVFVHPYQDAPAGSFRSIYGIFCKKDGFIDKLTTTNSTGVLEVQNSERLEVLDVKDIFEEYLGKN